MPFLCASMMAEITNEQKLYVLLKYKKNRTEKDERIISILKEKALLGSENLKDADGECCKQGWLNTVHIVEELGYTVKCSHKIELSESGLSQIEKFWRESKYNPKNVWKARVTRWSSVVTAVIAAIHFLPWLYRLVLRLIGRL